MTFYFFFLLEIDSPSKDERSTRKRAAAHSIPDSKKDRAELQSIGDERRKLRSLLCDQRENIDRYL